jgi:hypothetical protein
MEQAMKLCPAVVLGAMLLAPGAQAEEKFQKLSGAQIRSKLAGMEVSDEVHWRDVLERSGKVTSMSMGKKRAGKWRIDKDQLCIEFEKETPNCYEVWVSGNKVKLQREGILPLEGVIGPPSGRI